ncbi:MAG TPA: helix-turn-helix domain-containing protein [Polyangiaceae bacterium]|jgi:DNA-binding NarL/FixJ family response regulator|nr:helix-turn-helix domain-containing protein [Polyangiaceae bacterium]
MKPPRPSKRPRRSTHDPAALPNEPWPQPPSGLEVDVLDLDGDEIAILHFPVAPTADLTALSEAEGVVAIAIMNGMSNEEIASVRGTSANTVAKQVASIFAKLGVGSRRELIARVRDGGPGLS